MNYAHKQWSKLIVYVDDERFRIDNNLTETAIRPFVIGRKNWLFCNTVAGDNASANLYTLIETARANGLEDYAYLRTVFTELPQATSADEIDAGRQHYNEERPHSSLQFMTPAVFAAQVAWDVLSK